MAAPVYATAAELALWGLPQETLDTIPAEVQTAMLSGASRDIDRVAKASGHHAVPLVSWGDDIKQAVCEIAAWKIMAWRGYNPEGENDPLQNRHDKAIKWVMAAAAEGGLAGAVDATGDATLEGAPIVYSSDPLEW